MKTIAIICMLIDHIGLVFFPDQLIWRAIGRLAMPIFVYGVARGVHYTHSVKEYGKRLFYFALYSQLPYYFFKWAADDFSRQSFEWLDFNIGFTFCTGVLLINLIEKERKSRKESSKKNYKSILLILMLIIGGDALHMDYGSYGLLLIISFYFLYQRQQSPIMYCIVYTVITFGYQAGFTSFFVLQEMGVIGLGLCFVLDSINERKLRKFFYLFYPLHMAILAGIALLIK